MFIVLKKGLKGWNISFYPEKYNQDYFKEQMKVNQLFVVNSNNKVCGVMLLKEEDKDFWSENKPCYYIHHLATDINLKGIGKLLLNYALEQCKKITKNI